MTGKCPDRRGDGPFSTGSGRQCPDSCCANESVADEVAQIWAIRLIRLSGDDGLRASAGWCPLLAAVRRVPVLVRH